MKSKSKIVIGKLPFGNALWLEYHSVVHDKIFMTIVTEEKDIKKLQSLNIIYGSTESYGSYCTIMEIIKKGAFKVSGNKIDMVVKMRFNICNTITVIMNYENEIKRN